MTAIDAQRKWAGRRVSRVEDPGMLTGSLRYVTDVTLPRMLEMAFVRSTMANARITEVDASAARQVPGVRAVIESADVTNIEPTVDIMPDEKRLLERRRTVRREEVNPSIPARQIAGAGPNQQATTRTNASVRVNVILSCVKLRPTGNRKCCTNIPAVIISGTSERIVSCSCHPKLLQMIAVASSQTAIPTALTVT